MNYDKSLVPHFAFPPTLPADGFLLADCHYKALRGRDTAIWARTAEARPHVTNTPTNSPEHGRTRPKRARALAVADT